MKHQQNGFTLVELLITLVLSGMLIAGIAEVFLQSNKSFIKQQTLSFMAEDGRYAQEMLAQEFRRLGFLINKHRIGGDEDTVFQLYDDAVGSGISLLAGEFIRGEFNIDGFANRHDINHLVFRYQLDPSGTCSDPTFTVKADCLNFVKGVDPDRTWQVGSSTDEGNSPCSGQVPDENDEHPERGVADIKTISFYIDDSNGVSTLFCRAESNRKDGSIVSNNGDHGIPLISNVERIYVIYGEDADGDRFANKYVRADQVVNWKRIVSARVYLVLMSEEKNISTATPGYQIDDVDFTVTDPDEKRIYRVFSTTLSFRNVL